jgi:stress-induced morphogen
MTVGVLKKAGGEVVCERCELANTPLKRMRGLLGRSGLDEDEGMLFRPAGSIHMFFMRFPIDAVFCDRDLVVVGVERDLKPWKTAVRERIQQLLEGAFPQAEQVKVIDRTGGGDHFEVIVHDPAFNGLSRIEQHKLIYAALDEPWQQGNIHELRINTKGTTTQGAA